MRIKSIDHFVLTVGDIEATCGFYSRVLGVKVVAFGEGRKAIKFGSQKINLHQAGHEFEPKAARPTPGSGDVCFVSGGTIAEILRRLADEQVPIVAGPVARTGALGPMQSVYFRDPNGNLIEVAVYDAAGWMREESHEK